MKKVRKSEGITIIAERTFDNCKKLNNIKIPNILS